MNGMARKARKNLSRSVSLLKKYSDEKYQKIEEKEVLIDKYEDKLGTYLMQLTGKELSGDQTKQVPNFCIQSVTLSVWRSCTECCQNCKGTL